MLKYTEYIIRYFYDILYSIYYILYAIFLYIYSKAMEKMKFSLKSGTSRGILFDVMDWIGVTDQIENRYKSQHNGDVYTDIQFAANEYITSWYYRKLTNYRS